MRTARTHIAETAARVRPLIRLAAWSCMSVMAQGPNFQLQAGLIRNFYMAMNSSVLVDFFRTALLPTFGIILSPLLPDDIADLLVAP